MSIFPQTRRLTSGDGHMLTPDTLPKDFYPAPGEYDLQADKNGNFNMTQPKPLSKAATRASPKKTFGSALQRPTLLPQSPTKRTKPPGPGSYEISKQLASDLPGSTTDYHDLYIQVAKDLVNGRRAIGLEFEGVKQLSIAENGIYATQIHPLDDDNSDNDDDDGTGIAKSVKPRDDTANRFQQPAPDPYTWMLGPGSYDDMTMNFGPEGRKTNKQGKTITQINALKSQQAKWGVSPNIAVIDESVLAQTKSIVSNDRLPSETLIIGYKASENNKDFNQIYKNVAHTMELQKIQRLQESKSKGWKKQLQQMKNKRRKNKNKPISKFQKPSTFSSEIRFDPNEDKKKLGTLEPGPGQYETPSSFEDNSEMLLVQELMKQKKKMKEMDGLDLDNNGIDDGLEREALLPKAHKNKTTSSFMGDGRDSLKLMQRYGKGGSNPDVPGPNFYKKDYLNRSPSMYKPSSNVLSYKHETLEYRNKPLNRHQSKQEKKITLKDNEYDARGTSYDRIKQKYMQKTKQNGSNNRDNNTDRKEEEEDDYQDDFNQVIEKISRLPSLSPKKNRERTLSYHEKNRRPRFKSRHGLEEQNWFSKGNAPCLKEDKVAHQLQGHSGHTSANMKKANVEKERLKIDTIKLGNVFFSTSPTKLLKKEWMDNKKRLE